MLVDACYSTTFETAEQHLRTFHQCRVVSETACGLRKFFLCHNSPGPPDGSGCSTRCRCDCRLTTLNQIHFRLADVAVVLQDLFRDHMVQQDILKLHSNNKLGN